MKFFLENHIGRESRAVIILLLLTCTFTVIFSGETIASSLEENTTVFLPIIFNRYAPPIGLIRPIGDLETFTRVSVTENGKLAVIVAQPEYMMNLYRLDTDEYMDLSRYGKPYSGPPLLSPNGKYLLFTSDDPLITPDLNGTVIDVFLVDLETWNIENVSVSSTGEQGNAGLFGGDLSITPDGRYVAFTSLASNLVPNDTNGVADVFVRDRITGNTERVSISSTGREGKDPSYLTSPGQSISADGRFVVFLSYSAQFAKGDRNVKTDVFVHDRQTGETNIVSTASDGSFADDNSSLAAITANGRYIVFVSWAGNLLASSNGEGNANVFIRDLLTGNIEMVSVTPEGLPGNGQADHIQCPMISDDGRFVLFDSYASDLVPDDTNNDWDTFIRDRGRGKTYALSLAGNGLIGDAARGAFMTRNGKFTTFRSEAQPYLFESLLLP